MLTPILTTVTLILGIGNCSQSGDWCPTHPAKAAVEVQILQRGKHSIDWNITHISDTATSLDRGIEVMMIEYQYKFNIKELIK